MNKVGIKMFISHQKYNNKNTFEVISFTLNLIRSELEILILFSEWAISLEKENMEIFNYSVKGNVNTKEACQILALLLVSDKL